MHPGLITPSLTSWTQLERRIKGLSAVLTLVDGVIIHLLWRAMHHLQYRRVPAEGSVYLWMWSSCRCRSVWAWWLALHCSGWRRLTALAARDPAALTFSLTCHDTLLLLLFVLFEHDRDGWTLSSTAAASLNNNHTWIHHLIHQCLHPVSSEFMFLSSTHLNVWGKTGLNLAKLKFSWHCFLLKQWLYII